MAEAERYTEAGGEVYLTVRLPKDLHAAFGKVCRDRDLTKSQVVRGLLRSFVSGQKEPKLDR